MSHMQCRCERTLGNVFACVGDCKVGKTILESYWFMIVIAPAMVFLFAWVVVGKLGDLLLERSDAEIPFRTRRSGTALS